MARDETVSLELAERSRQHPLCHAVHSFSDVCVPEPAIDTEGVNDAERPPASCMSENLASHTVFVLAKPIANRLRIGKHLFSDHYTCLLPFCLFS
jgi:hypothetical protein